MFSFDGKVVLVTGASRGIGKSIAEAFKNMGADVIGTYMHEKNSGSEEIELCHLDVTNRKECEELVEKIIKQYGKIDVLVNNAGITADSLTKRMTDEQFDNVINTNMKGVFNVTRIVGPLMQSVKSGAIINISSIVGEYGNIGQANYAAAKAAVIGMTKTWAKEFAYNGADVRVNAVAPGYTVTDMLSTVPKELLDKFAKQTMLGRLARPDEIANVVVFLASDMASYITGTVIDVNGGMRI